MSNCIYVIKAIIIIIFISDSNNVNHKNSHTIGGLPEKPHRSLTGRPNKNKNECSNFHNNITQHEGTQRQDKDKKNKKKHVQVQQACMCNTTIQHRPQQSRSTTETARQPIQHTIWQPLNATNSAAMIHMSFHRAYPVQCDEIPHRTHRNAA